MSRNCRVAANRKTAKKSTGPKPDSAKQRVSHNARRHGIISPPDANAVSWRIEVIQDDPALVGHDLDRKGIDLVASSADAEARLERAGKRNFNFSKPVMH